MRSVDSIKQAGPLCEQQEYRASADALVRFQRAQGKDVPHIPMHLRTRQNHTLDPSSPTTFRMVEFQLEDICLVIFILNMDRKPSVVEYCMLGPSMARMALKGGKTKNGGTSDNNDNARVSHRLVQGELHGEVRAKNSQLLSSL